MKILLTMTAMRGCWKAIRKRSKNNKKAKARGDQVRSNLRKRSKSPRAKSVTSAATQNSCCCGAVAKDQFREIKDSQLSLKLKNKKVPTVPIVPINKYGLWMVLWRSKYSFPDKY